MKKDTTHCREQFKEIYLNNQRDKIIPFLQQLSKEEKKGLIPLLKNITVNGLMLQEQSCM